MLTLECARWLIAPGNAVPQVKEAVRAQKGYVSDQLYGYGLLDGLGVLLGSTGSLGKRDTLG